MTCCTVLERGHKNLYGNTSVACASDVVETTNVETEIETEFFRDHDQDRDRKILRKCSPFNYFKNDKFLFSKEQSKITIN